MFRATKPSVPRTRSEKHAAKPAAEVSPAAPGAPPALLHDTVPRAVVPDLPLDGLVAPMCCASDPAPPAAPALPVLPTNPQAAKPRGPDDVTADDVQRWERKLEYRPFYVDDDGPDEDLFREVREDRKIPLGNDPLIADMLQMFPVDERGD